MSDPISLLKDSTRITINKETPAAATVALSKHRHVQRIIKKHLQQKYLLCGFVIHALLASPVYLYGIIVDNNTTLIIRIWPPIIYQAIGQICHSFLLNTTEKLHISSNSQWENRKIFLFATISVCTAIIVCGFLFSSAWIGITSGTQLIAVIVYGLFGGIGSSLIYTRTYIILETVRPKEDKYVQKTIHICGEAFCQLFLCFVFTNLRSLYGISQTLTLMGALLTNLIPLGLLISHQDKNLRRTDIPFIKSQENIIQGVNRFNAMHSVIEQIDGIEMQQNTWKNPRNVNELRYNAMSFDDAQDSFTTYINSNGVEIMEIIPEEDENISMMRSSSATIDKNNKIINDQQNEKVIYDNQNTSNLNKIQKFSKNLINQIIENIKDNIFIPLQRAMTVIKLYPAAFLQSVDVFSYVMCLIVLPGLAVRQHALKFAEIPFLYSLLAFPWMCFALMTPRFGQSLVRDKTKWHAFGCILKALALFFISISGSKLLLSLAAVLLGFGQAILLFLQDLIIQSGIPRAQWIDVKYPLYLISGILILVWGTCAYFVINSFNFQLSVGFSAFLYFLSVTIWYLFTIKCTYKCVRT